MVNRALPALSILARGNPTAFYHAPSQILRLIHKTQEIIPDLLLQRKGNLNFAVIKNVV